MSNDIELYSLGVLHTKPLDADAAGHATLSGIGQFYCEVVVGLAFFTLCGDKKALCRHTIAMHLAVLIKDTTVPARLWYFTATPEVQSLLNFAEVTPMRTS